MEKRKKTRCVVVGAMKCESDFGWLCEEDFVILADSGYLYKEKLNYDLIIGDFDSLGFIPDEENVMQYPVHKDDTDMMLAVKAGLERGYEDFLLLGGIGGRLDHTIANIQTLAYLKSLGKRAKMIGEGQQIELLKNETRRLLCRERGIVSVFAYGDMAKDVSIEGLLYEVSHVDLSADFPLGVSNHWNGQNATITVGEGRLLLILTEEE